MTTESLRAVRNNLSHVIQDPPKTGPVVVAKSGKASAVLLPVDADTDLETLLRMATNRELIC